MQKYEIILYWSADDNAYIAEVPELAGCMADGSGSAAQCRTGHAGVGRDRPCAGAGYPGAERPPEIRISERAHCFPFL